MQKGLQEIYRNGTRNRNRGYYTGGTVRNHEIFRALCPKLKNVEELQDPIHRGLLLGVEDTGYVTIEHPSQTYCFYCFPCSFLLLFPIALHQLCLPHHVGAPSRQGIDTYLQKSNHEFY